MVETYLVKIPVMASADSEVVTHCVHLQSLTKICPVSLSKQRGLWPDCADAQADLRHLFVGVTYIFIRQIFRYMSNTSIVFWHLDLLLSVTKQKNEIYSVIATRWEIKMSTYWLIYVGAKTVTSNAFNIAKEPNIRRRYNLRRIPTGRHVKGAF